MAGRQKCHERIVAPVADPLSPGVHLAASRRDTDYVCYEGPEGWAFASGVAAELTADRDRLLLRSAEGETSRQGHDQQRGRKDLDGGSRKPDLPSPRRVAGTETSTTTSMTSNDYDSIA